MGRILGSLEKIGIQAELVKNVGAKLTGQNIDEVQLHYKTELRGKVGPDVMPKRYLAGLTYLVKLETLKESRDLTAEIDEYGSNDKSIKWIGGELAFRLNEDPELMNLLMKAGEKTICTKVNKRLQHVEMYGGFEDYPETPRESFEVFDRIAAYVRAIAQETGTIGEVSRGQHRVVRGSICRRVIYATIPIAVGGFCFDLINFHITLLNPLFLIPDSTRTI